ncbi:hypothetical protein SAMN05216404_10673 [Nitrosospira multiformis]|uniref:Uncharacterized protein n=1 Tax=Nitrosospira multiformis TaxID=1231 RepID=A0A1H8IHF3_9PROT|nr:hypothetical protein SAMN05216404_10673 [Nitrosospira multiformis]
MGWMGGKSLTAKAKVSEGSVQGRVQMEVRNRECLRMLSVENQEILSFPLYSTQNLYRNGKKM